MVFGVPHREWLSSPSVYSSLSWSATLSCTGFPFTSQMLVSIYTRAEKKYHMSNIDTDALLNATFVFN